MLPAGGSERAAQREQEDRDGAFRPAAARRRAGWPVTSDVNTWDADIGGGRAKGRIDRWGRGAVGNARCGLGPPPRKKAQDLVHRVGRRLMCACGENDFGLDRKSVVRIGFLPCQCGMHWRSPVCSNVTRIGAGGFTQPSTIPATLQTPARFDQSKAMGWRG